MHERGEGVPSPFYALSELGTGRPHPLHAYALSRLFPTNCFRGEWALGIFSRLNDGL